VSSKVLKREGITGSEAMIVMILKFINLQRETQRSFGKLRMTQRYFGELRMARRNTEEY
jgi:hypothetical protein